MTYNIQNIIVEHRAGSHAYGTALPTSDLDIRGVFVAQPINIRTPFFPVREVEGEGEDTKYYEVSNFLKLIIDQNPNIIETLWVNDSDITIRTPAYEMLRNSRDRLLSSKLAYTFSGYAVSQLKRIKGHNKWIMNPQPIEEPQQKDFTSVVFNMTDKKEFNKIVPTENTVARDIGDNHYVVYPGKGETWLDKRGNPTPLTNEFFAHWESEQTPLMVAKVNLQLFKEAHENWKNYWIWKENRNQARSELEERFGYDTKHAMHLVRLMRMGYEGLTQHQMFVRRHDAKELLDIRNGKWSYEELIEYSEEMDAKIKQAYTETKLQRSVDLKFVAHLLMDIQDLIWSNNES